MNENLIKKAKDLIENSEDAIQINIYRLEKELQYQAMYYRNYSSILADLQERKSRHRALLDSQERLDYLKSKGKSPSEAYIDSTIKNNSHMIDLQVSIEKLEGILKAFDYKKKALECLVQLELAGYYSEPKTNHETF